MIRVFKSENAPASLATKESYDGEDVKKQLLEDQYGKCFVCERKLTTDFEIDHLKSRVAYPELAQTWQNLHLICGYCNRKKANRFDGILSPSKVNIEDEITQRMGENCKQAVFSATVDDESHNKTIELLSNIFNGTGKIRNTKEERFFNQFRSAYNSFLVAISRYVYSHSKDTECDLAQELSIDKEFLGFKYHLVKSNAELNEKFADLMPWNKKP